MGIGSNGIVGYLLYSQQDHLSVSEKNAGAAHVMALFLIRNMVSNDFFGVLHFQTKPFL